MRKATAAQLAPETRDEPELIVDREFKSPRPLDRNISTVTLKTPTNNPTEGYDLQLSATFGKERISLISDDFEIEVDLSMEKANIELSFHHCEYTEINEHPRVEEYKRTITEHAGKHSNALAKLAGRLSASAAGVTGRADLDANIQRTAMSSLTSKQEIVRYDWHRLGGDAITVGPTGSHLQGPMITDFKGWRVTPYDAGQISGVVARVKVREQWIKFENADIVRHPAGLIEKVKRLMNDHRRKQFFELLLRHLMMKTELRLHQEGNGTDATIASHVLLVRPFSERAMSPYAGQSRRQVTIDGAQVEQWLAAEEGHEVSALIALGLQADVIRPSAEGEPTRQKRGTFFIPDSAPPHALAAFEHIYKAGSIPRNEMPFPTTYHDLRSLGLIAAEGDTIRSLAKPNLDPNILLRRAASGMECINVARQVLRINPNAKPVEVASAVALELGKNWPTLGSKKRNGGAIMRWAVWLEPHLLDESSSSDAATRIAFALENNTREMTRGRPASLRKAREPELRRLVAEGLSKAEIAKQLNVSPATISNWRRALGI